MSRAADRAPVWILGIWLAATLGLWAMAFAPSAAMGMPWLAAAKSACFGTLPNGLPDASGWMILVLSPLSFLAGILITWRGELLKGLLTTLSSVAGRSLVVIAVATALWEASWVGVKIRDGVRIARADFRSTEIGDLPDNYPRGSAPAPGFELVDQGGVRTSLAEFHGKTVFLTFAFAHCQTMCPAILAQSKAALSKLSDQDVALVLVTLDPWRDTPKSLPSLAKKWDLPANARVLSGEPPVVTAVLDAYKVPWKRDEKTGDVTHAALTYVVDPDGRIAYTFNNASASWLVQAANRLSTRTARN